MTKCGVTQDARTNYSENLEMWEDHADDRYGWDNNIKMEKKAMWRQNLDRTYIIQDTTTESSCKYGIR